MSVNYCVEAWTFPCEEDESEPEKAESAEFSTPEGAQHWVWERLQEGYAVRLWLR